MKRDHKQFILMVDRNVDQNAPNKIPYHSYTEPLYSSSLALEFKQNYLYDMSNKKPYSIHVVLHSWSHFDLIRKHIFYQGRIQLLT